MITVEKVLHNLGCSEHVYQDEWYVPKKCALKAMEEYHRLKVAESESKNLKQAHVSSNGAIQKENKKESEVAVFPNCKAELKVVEVPLTNSEILKKLHRQTDR